MCRETLDLNLSVPTHPHHLGKAVRIRDDEARVRPFRADFDACDDPLETVGPPNSKGGPKADPSRYPQIACGEFIYAAYTKRKDDDDFGQACTLVRKVMDDAQRDRLVSNVVGHLKNGATKPVLERALTANPS
jgi:catalase